MRVRDREPEKPRVEKGLKPQNLRLSLATFQAETLSMVGTFPATARFQDSDFSQEDRVETHIECDFAPFRNQTLTQSHPCIKTSQTRILSIQFSSLTDWVTRGDMRDDSAEILFQSLLWEAIVSSSGIDRDIHTLMLAV